MKLKKKKKTIDIVGLVSLPRLNILSIRTPNPTRLWGKKRRRKEPNSTYQLMKNHSKALGWFGFVRLVSWTHTPIKLDPTYFFLNIPILEKENNNRIGEKKKNISERIHS